MQTEFCFNQMAEKQSPKIQKQRVLDFIKRQGGVITNWQLEKWGVEEYRMSAGSATRHARTLAKEGILEHPIIDCERNKHSWKIRGEI